MNTRLMIEATKANKAGDCTVYVEVSVSKLGEKKKTVRIIILPKNRANGLVKKSFNFNTRYDKTNPTQILA